MLTWLKVCPCDLWMLSAHAILIGNCLKDPTIFLTIFFTVTVSPFSPFFFVFFYILSLDFSFIPIYIYLLSLICKNLYTGCISSFLTDINYCTHGAIHILAICIIRGEHHFCTNIYYQGLFRNKYRIFLPWSHFFSIIFSNNEKRRKSLHFDDVTHVFFIFVFI